MDSGNSPVDGPAHEKHNSETNVLQVSQMLIVVANRYKISNALYTNVTQLGYHNHIVFHKCKLKVTLDLPILS